MGGINLHAKQHLNHLQTSLDILHVRVSAGEQLNLFI